jgi:DNA-binding CsgD family transcriptional regulator
VILVGSPSERAELRARINGAAMQIVGEYPTLASSRAADVPADAVLLPGRVRLKPDTTYEEVRLKLDPTYEPLTRREIQVLERLAEGLPNKVIAARLGISDQTVKFHVASIAGKLGAANRTDIVGRAVRRGLITL